MKLTLKTPYKEVVVQHNHPSLGTVVFNSRKDTPDTYEYYYNLGITGIFNVELPKEEPKTDEDGPTND